jgi:hypothetical protein
LPTSWAVSAAVSLVFSGRREGSDCHCLMSSYVSVGLNWLKNIWKCIV